MVALVSKQVTAYNAVNNSTVSRTSASKYGEFIESSWGGEAALSSCCLDSSTTGRPWTPGAGSGGAVRQAAHQSGEQGWGRGSWFPVGTLMQEQNLHPPENLTFISILQDRRCFRFVIFINVYRVHNNPVD